MKAIPLNCREDVRICSIFSQNANRYFGRNQVRYIQDNGGLQPLDGYSGYVIYHPLTQWECDEITPCALEDLKDAYNQVLKQLVNGWVVAEDNPDILIKKDPENFQLFIKEDPYLKDEDVLIKCLIKKFSMTKDVKCHREGNSDTFGKLYMWVRKSSLKEVEEKFGFKLT